MNWEKLNINEVVYYCTSWDIDFDCLPFSCQIENIIRLFYYYGIVEFETGDIKEFYKGFQISNPRSDGIRNPRLKTIQNSLEHTSGICRVSENVYRILNMNTDDYELCVKQGYYKNAIMCPVFIRWTDDNSVALQISALKKLVPGIKKISNAELINYAKEKESINVGEMCLSDANKLIARGKAEGLTFYLKINY